MQRHFDDMTEIDPGAKRLSDAIALCEDCTRAAGTEEIA
jgi:hypothetical protein